MKTDSAASSAPPAATTIPVVKAVRAGDRNGVTYVVLEVTAKAAYTASLMSDGKRVVVDLPDTSWSARPSGAFKSSALGASYKYEKGTLTITAGKAITLKGKQVLKPDKSSPNYRIVLDLAPVAAAPAAPAAPAK